VIRNGDGSLNGEEMMYNNSRDKSGGRGLALLGVDVYSIVDLHYRPQHERKVQPLNNQSGTACFFFCVYSTCGGRYLSFLPSCLCSA
jgi:hypothetical protein